MMQMSAAMIAAKGFEALVFIVVWTSFEEPRLQSGGSRPTATSESRGWR